MHVTLVHVEINPEHIDDFILATQQNYEASIQEVGNLRFDVLQSPENATLFVLYEAFDNAHSAALHKKTDHYLTWKGLVADWMAVPRHGIQYTGIFPAEKK